MQKPSHRVQFLQDVFDIAGGSAELAVALKPYMPNKTLHAYTVENWRRSGIPQKYWGPLFELYGITPFELHQVWHNCRKQLAAPSKISRRA